MNTLLEISSRSFFTGGSTSYRYMYHLSQGPAKFTSWYPFTGGSTSCRYMYHLSRCPAKGTSWSPFTGGSTSCRYMYYLSQGSAKGTSWFPLYWWKYIRYIHVSFKPVSSKRYKLVPHLLVDIHHVDTCII